MKKPNCETCKYRQSIPGDCHSRCTNGNAHVKGHAHGIKMGWFSYPWNFDPTWLLECDGYEKRESPNDQAQARRTGGVDCK
jgi:hypothetical protein